MYEDANTSIAVAGPVDRQVRPLRAAYADPPCLGLAQEFYGHLPPEAAEYDKLETHQRLIDRRMIYVLGISMAFWLATALYSGSAGMQVWAACKWIER